MVFSVIVPAAAFPVKFILEHYLTKYIDCVNTVFLLFAAQIFYIIIKSIYVNLSQVQRKQKLYFIKLIIILVIGVVLNVICFKMVAVKEAFAVGTLLSSIIWFIISSIDFKYLQITFKECCFLFLELIALLISGFMLPSVIGCLCYVIFTIIMMLLMMRNTFFFLIFEGKKTLKKIKLSGFDNQKEN